MKSTERFSDRVESYVKHRPRYSSAVIELLERECGLAPSWVVADVGSGTGFSSEIFLRNGNTVYGVEPNAEMRRAAEHHLFGQARFVSVEGTAEDTLLPCGSIDLVVAGQAFHWFDPLAAHTEWLRILKPGGWAVLMWNERPGKELPFFEEYEQLMLAYGTDYAQVSATGRATDERLGAFYRHEGYREVYLPNDQKVDWAGLEGRVLSASYAPLAGHPNHEPMLAALRVSFERHALDGWLDFPYQTHVIWGRL